MKAAYVVWKKMQWKPLSTCQSSPKGQQYLSLQPTWQKETVNAHTLILDYDETDRSRKRVEPLILNLFWNFIHFLLSGKQRWWTDRSRSLLFAPQRGTNSNPVVGAIHSPGNECLCSLAHIDNLIDPS